MEITFDEFKKVEIKIATIISAEAIEWSEKLLKILVDLGEERRTILSGIATYYKPEELIGKQVLVVTNLMPKKIKDLESQGMILASEDKDGVVLLSPIKNITNGSMVL